jgi:hypothetical protein
MATQSLQALAVDCLPFHGMPACGIPAEASAQLIRVEAHPKIRKRVA